MTDWRRYVRTHLPPLAVPPERELEIVEELALQLEAAFDAAVAAGASADEARDRALSEVPDWTTLAASIVRAERRPSRPRLDPGPAPGLRGFSIDLMRASAALWRAPGFSAVCILTLAVGLGIGLTAFLLVTGVLLAPLPFASPERLILVHATVPPEGRDTQQHAYPDIADLAQSGAFTSVAALVAYSGTTTLLDPPIRVQGLSLTTNAFDVFGVSAIQGRTLVARDGERGAAPVVVLGHGLWTRLGSPPDIVGTTMVLDELPRTIVGIAPARFRFDVFPDSADVFVPITQDFGPILESRAVRAFRVVGRLADSVSRQRADTALATVSQRLAQAHPATNQGRHFSVRPLRDDIVGNVRAPLLLVGALVAVVVVIVAVNLGSFLLSRAITRAREMSIRLALGASSWRLARESFAEAVVLAAAGAVVAFGFARVLIASLRTSSSLTLPRLAEIEVSNASAGWLFAIAMIVAAALSMLAHLSPRRLQALSALRTGHETSDRRVSFIRGAMVAGQTALAFVLLSAALLLAISLRTALNVPVGFDQGSVVTMRMMVPASRYESRETTTAFYGDVLTSLRAQAGIEAAGLVSALPLDGGAGSSLTIAGKEQVPEALRPSIRWYWASSGYFKALGIPVLQGRDFSDADMASRAHVTIVNASLARLHFPGENPIGKRVYFGPVPAQGISDWHEIVGVVGDIHNRTIEEGALPAAFDLFGQHWGRSVSLAVRSEAGPGHVTSVVRRVVADRDPRLALFAVRTSSDLVRNAVSTRRLLLWLVAGFAVIGSLLAILGLYGTVSYVVAGRTREMGVRIAVGATAADIHRLVLGYGARYAGTGVLVGAVGAIAMRGVLQSQLFGVDATNGWILAFAASVLLVASLMACVVPARRAVGFDTLQSLRAD